MRRHLRADLDRNANERSSVTRCDGQGVNRGNGSGSRASTGGRPGAPLPRVRGPVDRADRRASRPLASDGEGLHLRSDRGEGAGGQGPATKGGAAAAAPIPSRGRAKVTPTPIARRATPGRSSAGGRASAWSRRWSTGAAATVRSRRRTTGRVRTRAGVGERRSSGSPKESGPRRAWSPGSSVLGPSLAPWPRGQTWRCRQPGRRRSRDWAVTRSHCLIPGNRPQNPRI